MAASEVRELGPTDRRIALAVVMLSSFLTPFMASAINVALPSISREFSMSAVLLTWVATSYLLAAAAFLVPFGRLADIRGRSGLENRPYPQADLFRAASAAARAVNAQSLAAEGLQGAALGNRLRELRARAIEELYAKLAPPEQSG